MSKIKTPEEYEELIKRMEAYNKSVIDKFVEEKVKELEERRDYCYDMASKNTDKDGVPCDMAASWIDKGSTWQLSIEILKSSSR